MSHLAFVVAKKGVNAELATDPNDFVFHSDYNTFKIIKELTAQFTLVASTSNQTFDVSHGRTFIPFVTAFAKEPSKSQIFLPNSDNVDLWGPKLGWTSTGVRFNYIAADASKIYFNFDNNNATPQLVSVRYFILEKI